MARILPIQDVCPESEMEVLECRLLGNRIILRALFWLSSLDKDVLRDIETTFGTLPGNNVNDEWWSTTDGPAWLWWLVAVLPLRPEIKVSWFTISVKLLHVVSICVLPTCFALFCLSLFVLGFVLYNNN